MTTVRPTAPLVPGKDCFVAREKEGKLGRVIGHKNENQTTWVQVQWGTDTTTEWHTVEDLRNGFRIGNIVQDRPRSNIRKTLGTGTVRAVREIAGRDMVLVQLHNTGESRWLPYENLVRLRDAGIKYQRVEVQGPDSGERFRLKALAYALDSWNKVTGSLDSLGCRSTTTPDRLGTQNNDFGPIQLAHCRRRGFRQDH